MLFFSVSLRSLTLFQQSVGYVNFFKMITGIEKLCAICTATCYFRFVLNLDNGKVRIK